MADTLVYTDCPSYLGVRTEDSGLKPVEWHTLFSKTISHRGYRVIGSEKTLIQT